MFISILSTCFEGKILIAFTWLFQLDNKKAEMEGNERQTLIVPKLPEGKKNHFFGQGQEEDVAYICNALSPISTQLSTAFSYRALLSGASSHY
jgi:hypothetical protein